MLKRRSVLKALGLGIVATGTYHFPYTGNFLTDNFGFESREAGEYREKVYKDLVTELKKHDSKFKHGDNPDQLRSISWTQEQLGSIPVLRGVHILTTTEDYEVALKEVVSYMKLLPVSVIKKHLHAIWIGGRHSNEGSKSKDKDVGAYADASLKMMTLYQPFTEVVFFHELGHILFQHSRMSPYFTDRWMSLYRSENNQFSHHPISDVIPFYYGRTNIYEDMATIAQYMFSVDGWKELRRGARENTFYAQKVILMLKLMEEVSDGQMGKEYFGKIERGEIRI